MFDQGIVFLAIGGLVGITSSVIAFFLENYISRRRKNPDESRLPGCVMMLSGWLGVTGLIVTGISYLLSGSIRQALLVGFGILAGHTITFGVLAMLWLIANRRRSQRQFSWGKMATNHKKGADF